MTLVTQSFSEVGGSAKGTERPFTWDSPWNAGAGRSRGTTLLIFFLMVTATVTWREKVLYSGGVDPVVAVKAALSIVALFLAWSARKRCKNPRPMGTRTFWFVVGFCAISTFGGWAADQVGASVVLAIRMLILGVTMMFLVKTFPPARLLRDLMIVMATVGLIGAATGVTNLLAGARLRGTILPLNPNEIAMLCGLPAVALIWLLLIGRARLLHWLCLAVLVGVIWLTGSRTGLMALGVAGVIMLLQARKLKPIIAFFVACSVPIMVYLAVGTDLLASYFQRGGDQSIGTLSSRTIAWSATLTFPETEWTRWLGNGLAQKRVPVAGQYWDTQVVDSSWVSALLTAGLLGVLLLGVWFMSAAVSSLKCPRPSRIILTGLLAYLLIRSILESGLLDSTPNFLVFMLVSLLSDKVSRRGIAASPPAHDGADAGPQDVGPDALSASVGKLH